MALKKNEEIEMKIDSVTLAGDGVGRVDNLAVFVPACAEGDRLRVRIIKAAKTYAVGKIAEVLEPSRDRIEASCAAYPACGGCSFRHISYAAELRLKQRAVADAFKRIGGIEPEGEPICGGETDGYRNKAQYPLSSDGGELKIGFYARRSHRVVACRACALAPVEFETILDVFGQWMEKNQVSVYDEATGRGLVRHIYLRKAFSGGGIMVCPVINGDEIPDREGLISALRESVPGVETVVLNINKENTNVVLGKKCEPIFGDGYITDLLCGLKIRLSPLSFYQVNCAQAQRLYGKAAEYAEPDGCTVLDLYCGAGTIGLSMARRAQRVIGVETVEQAVSDAQRNAAENGIDNARFICADAGEASAELLQEGLRPDVVILDPPRKGCSAETVEAAAAMEPERIVYVSCDPATLARDCALFAQKGYIVQKYAPFDMFPRTAHVETVALLKKA